MQGINLFYKISIGLILLFCISATSACDSTSPAVETKKEEPKSPEPNKPTPVAYIPDKPVTDEKLTDDQLLDLIQSQTLRYFTEFAEPNSGMARERNTSGDLVTTGGTGFGIMAIIVGVERKWIAREVAVQQILKIQQALKTTKRYHGAWPHWLNGKTLATIPFSAKDDGGDLVETSFLVQGLLAAKEYFSQDTDPEKLLRKQSQELWEGVEWNWYTKNGQEQVLYWHWSEKYQWEMDLPIRGYNESLITYVLAAASPTHPITKEVYLNGWARNGKMKNGSKYYNITLPLGYEYGGPLFFTHYSFMGLDPRGLSDQYANYEEQNKNHSLINYEYCVHNPLKHQGYSANVWGLTASDEKGGYAAHAPLNKGGKDNGTITPTAALSSMPYTPKQSLQTTRFFYEYLKDKLWGAYGFKDAFNPGQNWTANSYLAIDQGPIVVMIENYRSALLWNTFMKNKDLKNGLEKLGFTINKSNN